MNDDYISRKAVLKICRAEHNKQLKKCNCAGDKAVSNIRADIINLPSSNVIEVVRCKDCKYLMFSDFYGECSKGYMGIVYPNDFCSHGERADMRSDNL